LFWTNDMYMPGLIPSCLRIATGIVVVPLLVSMVLYVMYYIVYKVIRAVKRRQIATLGTVEGEGSGL